MKKIITRGAAAACIMAAMMLSGCGTQKQATTSDNSVLNEVNMHRAQAERVQTKMQMALKTDEHHLTVGGNLRMERGNLVQLAIMPFGLVEVGVIEFTPEYVLFLYRTGHQYVKARYKDIDLLAQNGIDFNAVQSLFWGELFAPGRKTCTMDDFESNTTGNSVVLSTRNNKDIMVKFVTSLTGGILRQTQVTSPKDGYNGAILNWKYIDYMRVGKGELPNQFELSIEQIDRPVSCRFTLSNLKINPDWKNGVTTSIDKQRYEEVPLNVILSRLLNF